MHSLYELGTSFKAHYQVTFSNEFKYSMFCWIHWCYQYFHEHYSSWVMTYILHHVEDPSSCDTQYFFNSSESILTNKELKYLKKGVQKTCWKKSLMSFVHRLEIISVQNLPPFNKIPCKYLQWVKASQVRTKK